MAASEQTRQYLNPPPRSVLEVEAGSAVALALDFSNEAPNPQGFYLEIDGLPAADWSTGVGPTSMVVTAALGAGTLKATLQPPVRAAAAEYALTVRIIADGSVLDPPGDIALTLRVLPGPEPPEEEVSPEAARILEEVAAEEAATQATLETAFETSSSAPAVEVPAVEPAVSTPVPPPAPEPARPTEPVETPTVAEPPAVSPQPDIGPQVQPAPQTPAATSPAPETPASPPRPTQRSASAAQPRPAAPPRPAKPPAAPKPTAPSPPPRKPDEDMPVIDLGATRPHVEEEEEEEPAIAERSVVDPKEGTVISLKPGETTLVRFSFRNEQRSTRTYVIDEDRSLEPGWLVLVQDQVNINANGTGEVSVRLAPPITAQPGSYPFVVRVGPLGATLTPCSLVLEVQPTPAVKLTTKQDLVKVGPFGRAVDFGLIVESAGNADTSFRISVKDQTVETDEQGRPKGPDDLYETPLWRYLFDKEFETLESKAIGRPPNPIPLRLRMLRKGIWWFGFKEQHQARVKAVPVTDPTNGGKTENSVLLTAIRWRLLPIPGFLAWPLAIVLFLLLASGASNMRVTNAYSVGSSYYVLQMRDDNWTEGKPPVNMTAKLRWSAPWYALLRLKASEENRTETHYFVHGGYDDTIQVEEYGDKRRRSYEVGSLLRPGGDPIQVRFVPLRTDMKLLLTIGPSAAPVDEYERDESIGEDKTPLKTREVIIDVPRDGSTRINFSNLTDRNRGLKILVHPVTVPSQFRVENFTLNDSSQINPGETLTAKVTFTGTAPPDGSNVEEDWQFVTTDATHQVLHVRLRLKVD